MHGPSSPPPWTGVRPDDPTTQLPPAFTDGLPGAIPRAPADYIDLIEDQPEPSRWPSWFDAVLRYAPVGTAATCRRLGRWWTVHRRHGRLEDLRARGAWDEHDELEARIDREMAARKVVLVALAAVALIVLWRLITDHKVIPLLVLSVVLPAWYTAKGWALVHARRTTVDRPPPPAPGPTWTSPAPAEDQSGGQPVDHERTGPIGLLRRVRPDRRRTEDRGAETPRGTGPVDRPAGPCPLTQDRVERALKAAKKELGRIKTADDEPVVRVVDSKHMGNGWAVTVYMPEEVSAADMVGARAGIANAFSTLERGVPESCVILLPSPANPRLLTLWICDTPPLEGPPVRTAMWHMDRLDVNEGIPFGRTIEGEPVVVSPLSHWLIAGGTRSGKSESGGLLLLGCSLDPHVQQILMDPEGMGAWAAYTEVAEVIHGTGIAKLAEMAAKLEWVVDHEFPRRERAIAKYLERGSMVMSKPKVTPRMAQDPTAGLPWLVISIDEAHALYRCKARAPGDEDNPRALDIGTRVEQAAVQIITRGGKYGIYLHHITQKPTSDNIPTSITAIANTRLLFSVERTEMADAAMPGWRKLGMDPLALQPDDGRGGGNPGAGYLKGIGLVRPRRKWALQRAECADLGEVREILRRTHAMRLEERPELLPTRRPSAPTGTPSVTPATPQPAAPAVPLNLAPLRRVVEILEPNGTMLATAVIAELQHRWPVEHGNVVTVADLNQLLGRYGLRTRQPKQPDGSKPHRLSYGPCAHRLRELEHQSEHPSERPDGE